MKNSKISFTNILTLLLIVLSFVSTSVTFYKFIVKLNHVTPEHPIETTDLIFVILYGVVIPFCLTSFALLILKIQFDKVRTKFEETNKELVSKFSEEIIRPLKIDLINAIRPTAHYNLILNHKRKETLEIFVPRILNDFERRIEQLSLGHIYEHDPSKYHAFATSMFELAKTEIIATSIVDPKGFWDHPMALSYLEDNKQIIKKNIKFTRYFFVNDANKDASLGAIANNLGIGADVFIIKDDENFDKDYRIDACLIDGYIAVISMVDKTDNIIGVDAYIDDEIEVPKIHKWTKFLKNKRVDVTTVYSGMTKEQIIAKAPIPLRED